MIHEGILSKPASRKNKWRVITSVAAVFAVGVISFSMYQDILEACRIESVARTRLRPLRKKRSILRRRRMRGL
jgi:hypothetical protein